MTLQVGKFRSGEDVASLRRTSFFLLSLHSFYSFDSRYFGPIKQDKVIGIASPVLDAE